jgi:integrase
MATYNPKNERIKKEYFKYQQEAKQKSIITINGIRKAIARYEEYTGYKDFCTFNKEQAIGFKKKIAGLINQRTGELMSKSSLLGMVNALKDFFLWLAYQKGYKMKIDILEIEYLNLSEKDVRAAKQPKFKDYPTLEQIREVIFSMLTNTEIELRNRALIAFTLLTGARDMAIASLKLKHLRLDKGLVIQDPDEVKTKFSKRIFTWFFPVGDDIKQIVIDWVQYLKTEKLYGNNAPLFPKTALGHDGNLAFTAVGLEPSHWATATPIRDIFKEAFEQAGLQYFNPHSFRNTLVNLGERLCQTPEQFKAWSQNLGHEHVLTTFTSYGYVDPNRQGEVIKTIRGGWNQNS